MVEGWITKKLDALFTFSGGVTASRAQLSQKGYYYLHYGDIHGTEKNYVDVVNGCFGIPKLNIPLSKVSKESLLLNGDVIFVDASEDDEGVSKYVVVRNANNTPFISGLHTIVAKSVTDELDNLFREYCFQSGDIKSQIKYYAAGTKVIGISKTNIGKIELSFPISKVEQSAIAEALSDVDSLIISLQKLIAKKKAIKQGAMQELLTGKKRLPGFSGKWKHSVWQDVLSCFSSGATPYRGISQYYKGNIKWVSSGELNYNIIYDTIEHITLNAQKDTSLTLHPPGTFLMAITGLEAEGTRGSCAMLGSYATTNQSCMAIYGTEKMDIRFLFQYYILHGDELAFQYCQGTKQQSYTANIVKILPIYHPVDVEEQTAIVQVLTEMDTEIKKLDKKLFKYRLIKQGMMQELLTGRIRLVDVKSQPKSELKVVSSDLGHNQQFDDAVMIAGIVDAFYSDKFPLGRVKVQKLLYMIRRKEEADISAFKKKAAGPYADTVRYKGGEPIAINSGYIVTEKADKGTRFKRGPKIGQALGYIQSWDKQPVIDWLVENFQYAGRNDLELYTTVDMAMCDLRNMSKPSSLDTIKQLIHSTKEWKAKLSKTYFSDLDIQRAIKKCRELFGGQ